MSDPVLVTGGTGYVAGRCIVELLHRGYDVRTTSAVPRRQNAVHAAVRDRDRSRYAGSCFVADLTAYVGWDSVVTGCRAVLHVASPLGAEDGRGPDAVHRSGAVTHPPCCAPRLPPASTVS